MYVLKWSAITVIGMAAALVVPTGAIAAEAAGGAPGITLNLAPAVGREGMSVEGTAPAARLVEATVYAAFSRDLPTVLLSRRIIQTDANGRYAATLSHAPAYFRGAIVTVVVRSLPSGSTAQQQLFVDVPNLPAPPDALPPGY